MTCRGVALFAALGLVVATASGCASIDPTEQFFAIEFANDFPASVVLRACSDNDCVDATETWHLKPGATADDNISDRAVLTRWQVQGASGNVIGCLPLSFAAKYATVVVRLRQAVPCPGRHSLSLSAIAHGKRLGGET
jgi:hypothetical protein